MRTLTAERTMGSGYTRGRLPYFQLRYSWRLRASGMWRRVPCYRKTQRHSPPNQQTFSVTAELIRNLAFVGFVYPNRRQLDNRKILCLWNDIQFQLRAKSLVHKQRRIRWIGFFLCLFSERENTTLRTLRAYLTSATWWPKKAETCNRWQMTVQCSKNCVRSGNKYRHWLT